MSPIDSTSITCPTQLLVEGNDPRNFFQAFIQQQYPDYEIQVRNYGGISELRDYLGGFVKRPDFGSVKNLGLVRDAEHCAQSAFQSVQDALTEVGLSSPGQLAVRREAHPAVIVLILPSHDQPGMLETLLCQSFVGDPITECIDNFFACLDERNVSVKRPDKARARVYLTTKPEAHVSVGVAAQKKYWDLKHAAFEPVHAFIKDLHGGS